MLPGVTSITQARYPDEGITFYHWYKNYKPEPDEFDICIWRIKWKQP